jgi:hypothetical protein
MANETNHDRRCFLGAAATTLAIAQLGVVGPASAAEPAQQRAKEVTMKVLCISKWAKGPSPEERAAILPKEVRATLDVCNRDPIS